MQTLCKQCSAPFEITPDDLKFYEKISPEFAGKKELIPPPTLCPDCRMQRRFAFRNERKLYHRKCDATGRQIISAYSPNKPFRVFQREEWLSEKWDAVTFGRAFDFTKSFFKQYASLQQQVPALALSEYNNENCTYTNYVATSKNCYLIFGSVYCQDCYYGNPYYSVSCIDSLLIRNCELCCECITCEKCYGCAFCRDCVNCSDLFSCADCEGCSHCIGCTGLRNANYRIFNEPVSPEVFQEKKRDLTKYSTVCALRKKFEETRLRLPHRAAVLVQSEESTGNYIYQSKNIRSGYDVQRCHDCRHVAQLIDAKDCADCNFTEEEELCYEYFGSYHNQRQSFCFLNFSCADALNSSSCHACRSIFGCVGLQHKEYCILNMQYTKEEYETLVPKIIEHMRKTSEWGEFFPINISPFGYNETVAQDYFPLSKEDATKRGWAWEEQKDTESTYLGPIASIPDNIADADADVCQKIITCEATDKPFKIIPQELRIYRQLDIPLPRKCPEQRLKERLAARTPRTLWTRTCAKCSTKIQTTYAPDRPEIVYCESCYLSSVY